MVVEFQIADLPDMDFGGFLLWSVVKFQIYLSIPTIDLMGASFTGFSGQVIVITLIYLGSIFMIVLYIYTKAGFYCCDMMLWQEF